MNCIVYENESERIIKFDFFVKTPTILSVYFCPETFKVDYCSFFIFVKYLGMVIFLKRILNIEGRKSIYRSEEPTVTNIFKNEAD